MPLVPCPDCGKQHSDAATACPDCGRPTGASAAGRDRPQTVRIQKRTSPLTVGCAVFLVLGIVGAVISVALGGGESAPTITIPYEVMHEWSGGTGRAILIDPQYRTDEHLRVLGEQLRWEHRRHSHTNVEVFDDRRAAEMRNLVAEDRLPARDLAHHDQHKIGFYQKNSVSGHHQFIIALDGVDGDFITVPYPRP
jgi:hypothetical protein